MKTTKKILLLILTVAAVAMPFINFFSLRDGYVFIDNSVFNGFCYALLGLMLVNALYIIIYTVLNLKDKELPRATNILIIICSVLTLFFGYLNYAMATIVTMEAMFLSLYISAPVIALMVGLPLILLAFPKLKARARTVIAAVILLIVGLLVVAPLAGFWPTLRFETAPLVLDTGTGNYSVVWATNCDAQGYVTYNYNGDEYKVYSTDTGRKKTSDIHAVSIPREHLENNDYSVHSTRVIDDLAYGGKLGKTIDSEVYSFKGDRGSADINIYTLSDWHNQLELLEKSTSYLDKPDLVLMLGDFADFYVGRQQVIRNIIGGGAIATKSVVPAIFVRGNHEVRGQGGRNLKDLLGLESYYYQVERGSYMFNVIDSAEAHEDDYWEHLGFDDYKAYLEKELLWFQSLAPNMLYNIVLAHDTDFSVFEDLEEAYKNQLASIDAKIVIGGHTHFLDLKDEVNNGFGYYRFMDGGTGTLVGKKAICDVFTKTVRTYKASQMTFENNKIYFKGYDENGKLAIDEVRDK